MPRYRKIGRQTRRYKETEVMTVVIKRPPKDWKIWKVWALDPKEHFYSFDCEIIAAYPAMFDPTPKSK